MKNQSATESAVAKFPLILLAGGKSSRMGQPKGLVSVEGEPWILHQLQSFRDAGGTRAVVVLGYDSEAYFSAIPEFLKACQQWTELSEVPGLEVGVCENNLPEFGPFSSIQAGILRLGWSALLEPRERGVFILPVDCPAASPSTWQRLSETFLGSTIDCCLPELPGGRGGHPVLISQALANRTVTLDPATPESRLDQVIRELRPERLTRVSVEDPRVGMNLNTPEDWLQLRAVL